MSIDQHGHVQTHRWQRVPPHLGGVHLDRSTVSSMDSSMDSIDRGAGSSSTGGDGGDSSSSSSRSSRRGEIMVSVAVCFRSNDGYGEGMEIVPGAPENLRLIDNIILR